MVLTMPAVALRGMTILPGMIVHFDISRGKSLQAVEESMNSGQRIFLVTQKNVQAESPVITDLYKVGIIADIRQVIKLQNNIVRLLAEGVGRAQMLDLMDREDYLEADVFLLTDETKPDADTQEAMLESIQETFDRYARVSGKISKEICKQVREIASPGRLMDYIGNNLPVSCTEKQKLLEAVTLSSRYELLMQLLYHEIDIIGIKKDLQSKVKARVDKHQKEYVLREQMGAIREELGETDTAADLDEYERRVDELQASEEVRTRIRKEIRRLKSISPNSAEGTVSRDYIERLLEMPWDHFSVDNKDLNRAGEVLERDHYGLDKVKERILEYLAVHNLTGGGEAPILCLVGPPGTGKTSIAHSVAEALDRQFVRICLGGVRDEAEIRGHRRTYVGAMPGRIVQGLVQAGTGNPLMLLDEIDKMSNDYKGDPSSALLEVLDGEQNSHFKDHYVELPVDLSDVLFIATANDIEKIPRPLYDRMEIIQISGYTENEKLHIAREHLLDKQCRVNGLQEHQLTIEDTAIAEIIRSYTRESGVRELERRLGRICRKAATVIYRGKTDSVHIEEAQLEEYLGKKTYRRDLAEKQDQVGIVCGLAWTNTGGVTLEVEVNVMPGKGEIRLTGRLGDVMQESAFAAVGYIRSVSEKYGIAEDYFSKHDIHIHIPEGAVPKDGPSAGITMATAALSAVIGQKVRADAAMTGEVTLRGRVLPIGGLKEKLLAAKSAGIHKVCIPKENERDLAEFSEEITEGLQIVPVETMEQVTSEVFV